jgi:FkbM family methyltransferase
MKVVNTRFGKMSLIESDSLICRSLDIYGEWAGIELGFLKQLIKPGMHVLDIGAFIGTHSLALSEFVTEKGKVFAFEPRKEVFNVLSQNLEMNHLTNVEARQVALADKAGFVSLGEVDPTDDLNFGGLTLDTLESVPLHARYEVAVTTIDTLDLDKLDFIKIDVESMERAVLDGALNTILKYRPVIACECNSLMAGSEVLNYARQVGYRAYGMLASAYNPDNFNQSKDNFFDLAKELSLMLFPEEYSQDISVSADKTLTLVPLETIEDLVLPLLFKPQYPYEVLNNTAGSPLLGLNFPSPAFDEIEKMVLHEQVLQRQNRHLEQLAADRILELTRYCEEHASAFEMLQADYTSAKDELSAVYRSRSWRLTSSLRACGTLYKSFFSGLCNRQQIFSRSVQQPNRLLQKKASSLDLGDIRGINCIVIVPVFRGVAQTRECILAAMPDILASENAVMLLLNDASPENEMHAVLEELAQKWPEKIILRQNVVNLGFVKTVNLGLKEFTALDVVLLNSDVIVPEGWLQRLKTDAYSLPNVGTVTPLSNNATICSFPYCNNEKNPNFGASVEEIDRVFKNHPLPCVEAPTGVGFCMYIRRACLDDIGYFNEEKFGRGYGEENDFCQRALKQGWVNLISPNIYVYHEGGVSFSTDKQALVMNAMRTLDELHPDYNFDVQRFILQDPLRMTRAQRFIDWISALKTPKVVHISHALGGGVSQHIAELAEATDARIVHLLLTPTSEFQVKLSFGVGHRVDAMIFDLTTQYGELVDLLRFMGVTTVHTHHSCGVATVLLKLSHDLNAKNVVTVHDYYWMSANPTLTNEQGLYPGNYSSEIINPLYSFPKGDNAESWKQRYQQLIEYADCVIYPSQSTRDIFEQVYKPRFSIIAPHASVGVDVTAMPKVFCRKKRYIVAAIGALGKEKGADVLESLAYHARKSQAALVFKLIGYAYKPLKRVEITGAYQNKELKCLIVSHEVDILIFNALWPETFSYTLSYALDSGLPIVAPNIGVFAERLSARKNVLLYDYLLAPQEILQQVNLFILKLERGEEVKAPHYSSRIEARPDFYKSEYQHLIAVTEKHQSVKHEKRPVFLQGSCHFQIQNTRLRQKVLKIFWRIRTSRLGYPLTNLIPARLRRYIRLTVVRERYEDIALRVYRK